MHGLRDLRVVDFSSGIAGPYCTKLFADAGAEVVLVEAPGAAAPRAPLFRFLHASKRAVRLRAVMQCRNQAHGRSHTNRRRAAHLQGADSGNDVVECDQFAYNFALGEGGLVENANAVAD